MIKISIHHLYKSFSHSPTQLTDSLPFTARLTHTDKRALSVSLCVCTYRNSSLTNKCVSFLSSQGEKWRHKCRETKLLWVRREMLMMGRGNLRASSPIRRENSLSYKTTTAHQVSACLLQDMILFFNFSSLHPLVYSFLSVFMRLWDGIDKSW